MTATAVPLRTSRYSAACFFLAPALPIPQPCIHNLAGIDDTPRPRPARRCPAHGDRPMDQCVGTVSPTTGHLFFFRAACRTRHSRALNIQRRKHSDTETGPCRREASISVRMAWATGRGEVPGRVPKAWCGSRGFRCQQGWWAAAAVATGPAAGRRLPVAEAVAAPGDGGDEPDHGQGLRHWRGGEGFPAGTVCGDVAG